MTSSATTCRDTRPLLFRRVFESEGIPSVAKVGDAAAYGFVMINMLAQPPEFRRRFFARVQEAAARHELPADALTFAETRRRHTDVEDRYRTHTPSHPELQDQISKLLIDDQAVREKEGFDPKKMAEADRRTAGPLKAIFDRYGVPTYDMVGVQAAKDLRGDGAASNSSAPPERRSSWPRLTTRQTPTLDGPSWD